MRVIDRTMALTKTDPYRDKVRQWGRVRLGGTDFGGGARVRARYTITLAVAFVVPIFHTVELF